MEKECIFRKGLDPPPNSSYGNHSKWADQLVAKIRGKNVPTYYTITESGVAPHSQSLRLIIFENY